MHKITTALDLKSAIQELEDKQAVELILLKKQLLSTYESLKPVNIVKNSFKELISVLDLKKGVANAAVGISTGIITRKILFGKVNNPLIKLLGFILEMGVVNKVIKNADEIKSMGSSILKKIINYHAAPEKYND